ncbi:MAG TPA: hypothetical protein VFN36_07080 [Solirubrobacteraceae bacterium]|nr:hypothetical protein [Solirubrobacteraceae bacterium]
MPGVLALLAGALLAGCGAGGGSTTATTPAAPAPVVSGGGVQDATGSGGSGGSGPAAGKVSGGGSAGQFSTAKTGSFSHASPTFGSAKAQYGHVAPSSAGAGSPSTPASAPPAPSHPTRAPEPGAPTRVRIRPVIRTRTVVVYVTRVKLHTVYRERTVTKTVIKTKNPNVPAGAFLPSTHPVLAQTSFTVSGGNVGCRLTPGTARCGVQHRTWAPPVQPGSCTSTWGDTIGLASTGLPQFVCGGSSPIDPAAKLIPSGYDDTVGQITCQIRSFGVNCFNAKSRSGFVLSRTGYALY